MLGDIIADWIGINSSHLDSRCGESPSYTLADALDGLNVWKHTSQHIHWFILDLGSTYTISKVRGRSADYPDPVRVNVYVSDNKESWGNPVVVGTEAFANTSIWKEVNTTQKDGRYVKVEIVGTEYNLYLEFGHVPGFTIFDIYGELHESPPIIKNTNCIVCGEEVSCGSIKYKNLNGMYCSNCWKKEGKIGRPHPRNRRSY